MARTKESKTDPNLKYKHFSFAQRPVLPPIFISVEAYSRLIRSPTPSSRIEDFIVERSSLNAFMGMYSGIDTPITVATNETVSEDEVLTENGGGFLLDRVVGKVNNFFICPFCKKIVKKPQECIFCQNLMCKSCVVNVFKCPYGCETLTVNQLSKFAMLSYMGIQLKCCYSASGCEFIGTIKEIHSHEKDCDYSEIKCVNPVCDVVFMKKSRKNVGPVICSELCSMVLSFREVLENKDPEFYLEEFVKVIENAKNNMQSELSNDLEELMEETQRKKEEVEEYLKAKADLYAEIEDWRNYYHCGKWNQVVKWWNCCENKEKFSQGCMLIS